LTHTKTREQKTTPLQQKLVKISEGDSMKNCFSCQECKQNFKDKFQLEQHTCPTSAKTLRRLSNEEDLKCEYYECGREFNSPEDLTEHEKSHICKYYEDSKCMFGSRGSNEKGQCKYGHPKMCIFFQTRGCKKGDKCNFYHGAKKTNTNWSFKNRAQNGNFHCDQNGNRSNYSDARPVTGDFQEGERHYAQRSPNMTFLDKRIDRLEKLIQNFVQDKGQGPKR